MNRTQHLIASQPRPKRRVARPGASSLCFVPNTASAANDHHMGPGSEAHRFDPTVNGPSDEVATNEQRGAA
jgi:hypothetical protein